MTLKTTEAKRAALVGAFARFNYGDLLFPLVVGVGASVSLAAAAVLLQGAVLVRTVLTLRALQWRLGFGTRRLLRALAPSAGMALLAGLLAAMATAGCRWAHVPALLTLPAAAAVMAVATLALAVWLKHPLGQEIQAIIARRRRGSAPV